MPENDESQKPGLVDDSLEGLTYKMTHSFIRLIIR